MQILFLTDQTNKTLPNDILPSHILSNNILSNDILPSHTDNNALAIKIVVKHCDKIHNKLLKQLIIDHPEYRILYLKKSDLIWAVLQGDDIIKISADWQSHQSRIVKAGKNNELLLKACKLKACKLKACQSNEPMRVIDATAGFGIDGLILASTGARVTLIEQNPILFLLLKAEQHKMSQHPNWQKLMSRMDIIYGDSGKILHTLDKVDLIYLDPMFPSDSYKGLVNKHMQVLHKFVNPTNSDDEKKLFNSAIHKCDKLVIKRPISAPNFANINPMQSVSNDIVRFDKYSFINDR